MKEPTKFVAVIRDPVDGDVVCFCLFLGDLGSGLIGWSRTMTVRRYGSPT